MYKRQGGNVGIGTTSPAAKLDVYSSSTDPGAVPTLHVGDGTVDYGDYGMLQLTRSPSAGGSKAHAAFIRSGNTIFSMGYYNNTNTFGLWPSFSTVTNTPAMAFATDGNVGIGTASPSHKMNIVAASGDAEVHIQAQGNAGDAILYFNGAATNQRKCAIIASNVAPASHCKQDLHFCMDTVSDLGDVTIADSKMVITNAGNVGIGTNNPDYNLEVNGSVGVSGKQMYPMLRWEIDLTSQSNSNFYPIEFTHPVSEGTPDLPDLHPIHFKVFGESLTGGNPYNENTLVGYAKGGGWSDHGPMYDVHIRRFSRTEHRFQGIYEGQSIATEQIVIYMRGGYRYSAITDATSVVTHTSAYTIPHNTYPTTFAIKNSSGTDVSGTSAQISQLVNLAANARHSERFMSGDLHVDGYIKNSTTPSWSLYMQGSPTPTTSGTLEFNNTKASGINCTLNTGSPGAGLTSRVTITVAGRYFIGFQAFTEYTVTATSSVNSRININGSEYVRSFHIQPITNYSAMGGMGCVADLSVNDYVEIYSSQDIHYNGTGSFYGFMIA